VGSQVESQVERLGVVMAVRPLLRASAFAIAIASAPIVAMAATPADNIFTVGNFPVEARAKDAVAAKEKAVADGQKAALRSLIKRLVPVTAYGRLRKLNLTAAPNMVANMVDGVQVRSERNSSTEYIANLDFSFQPQAVRTLLQREGLAFVERQAAKIVLVPVWRASTETAGVPPAFNAARGTQGWEDAWKALDLDHALTPAKLETLKPDVHADTIKALANGDVSMIRTLATAYGGNANVVAAIATPEPQTKKLTVTLIGHDAVGTIAWKRAYRVDATDPVYAIELAAVVSLGVIEGRWKATTARPGSPGGTPTSAISSSPATDGNAARQPAPASTANSDSIEIAVEFRGMTEWQDISRRLAGTQGVEDVDVAGLSARGARVSLRYPGGPEQLADALSKQGLAMRNQSGTWRLSAQ
jgi:Uncharacterized protein conserved in bacteria (DUF2066)